MHNLARRDRACIAVASVDKALNLLRCVRLLEHWALFDQALVACGVDDALCTSLTEHANLVGGVWGGQSRAPTTCWLCVISGSGTPRLSACRRP
eukprot:984807-Rhodomonas_salina.1